MDIQLFPRHPIRKLRVLINQSFYLFLLCLYFTINVTFIKLFSTELKNIYILSKTKGGHVQSNRHFLNNERFR